MPPTDPTAPLRPCTAGTTLIETERDYAVPDDDERDSCSSPRGHEWVYTGTQYGGDDERWGGEGRCYCRHCGADGDA